MTQNMPDVTVIVPTFEQESTLQKCILSILDQDYQGKIKLIVVDNSKVFQLQNLVNKFPNVTFLWEGKPGSYNARNKALEQTDTEIIAFTDSDCIVQRDWVRLSVAYLRQHPEIGFIAGKISVFPNNKHKPSIAELYEQLFAFPQQVFLEADHFGATANMVTTLETMRTVGFFDGKLKSRGDMEWGQRSWNSGKIGHYVDDVVVFHPARLNNEIISKMKRVVAGARDRDPGWESCLTYVYRFLRPPRKKMMQVFKTKGENYTILNKIRLITYCLILTWVEAFYRVKFEITKSSSPR